MMAAIAPLACLAAPAQPPNQAPSGTGTKCPDIAVSGMSATLVSTLLGDPQVEIPMDTVRLEATLENVGSGALPIGTSIYIILKRNNEVVRSATVVDPLGAPGSGWTYSTEDSFPHGRKTTYVLQASSTLKECRLNNNMAALAVDEKKLHPPGDPDLSVAVFSVEKRWRQEGSHCKATFTLAADVVNDGTGGSGSASRLLFLIDGNQELAALDLAREALPEPGQKRRFRVDVPADRIPAGEHAIQASIEPAQNERNTQNNLSPNSGRIVQSAGTPAGVLASLEFSPWKLDENNLSSTMKITNLLNLPLRKLRLIMLRDGVLIKQWRGLSLAPRASTRVRYQEELAPARGQFGRSRFRALLASDAEEGMPPGDCILDECKKELSWVELGEATLQQRLQDKESGLAAQVKRKHGEYFIRESLAWITPSGIALQVNGRKSAARSQDVDFRASLILSPRLAAGRVYFDAIQTDVNVSSGGGDSFAALLAPVACQCLKNIIEKFAERVLAVNLPPVPGQEAGGVRHGALLGMVLVNGALDLYY
jgi:hypothetical protein